jgi:hypothetical protein
LAAVQGVRKFAARRPWLVCGLVCAALIAWLLSSALFSSRVLGAQDILLGQTPFREQHIAAPGRVSDPDQSDTVFNMQPDMLFARDALRHLRLPVWSPYIGSGLPQLATQQTAILYPANLLVVLFPFWQSLEWAAALKLLAAAIGTLLFLRRLGLRPLAGLLGAVAYTFSSFLIDWLEFAHVNTFALMPLTFWAADRLAANRRPRDAGLLALVTGSILLGGHPEGAAISLIAPALWLAMQVVRRRGEAAVVRTVALYALAGVLGAMLAGVMLAPFVEMLGQNADLTRSLGPFSSDSIFGLVTPELWGRPDKVQIAGGPFNYFERTAYLGVAPLILAAVGLGLRRTTAQLFFLVLFVVSLGLAVKLPLYPHFITDLPVLDRMNRGRWLIVVEFSGAVLAAYGLHVLLELDAPARRRFVAPVIATIVAVAPLLWLVSHHDVLSSFGSAVAQLPNIQRGSLPAPTIQLATMLRWALFAGVAILLVATAVWAPRRRKLAAVALVAVTAFELVSFQRGINPATPIAWANPPEPGLVKQMRRHIGHSRLAGIIEIQPNLANRFRLRDARKYELPEVKRYVDLWSGVGGFSANGQMLLGPHPARTADLFSVRWVWSYVLYVRHGKRWHPTPVPPIVDNNAALPRAWIAYKWRTASREADALAAVKNGTDSDAYRAPVIEGAPPPPGGDGLAPAPARFATDGLTHVRLLADAKRPARLVLNDTWYPGWTASVDGHSTPIEHANVAFRAVALPPGRHTVEFTYRPASVRIGELLTAIALIATALLIVSPSGIPGYRSRRRGSPATSAGDRP